MFLQTCLSKCLLTNSFLFHLSFQEQLEEGDGTRRRVDDESDDEGDPALEAVMEFVVDKLVGFEERLDSMEGGMRLMQQQAAMPPPPTPVMASIFGGGMASGSGSSTPKTEKFKPPKVVDDVKDEALREQLRGVWMPAPRSKQELLTEAQCKYVMFWLSRDGPPTGRNDLGYSLQLMDACALFLCYFLLCFRELIDHLCHVATFLFDFA